jgi:hypothetical protein
VSADGYCDLGKGGKKGERGEGKDGNERMKGAREERGKER